MKNLRSHFRFNKRERSGIFFLLTIIIGLQLSHVLFLRYSGPDKPRMLLEDDGVQSQIDSLKTMALKADSVSIYPFNPNFINDHKGYVLGMSPQEIDRLHAFRKNNKYVGSPKEFQEVTKVSDSLLRMISPYFIFPEWTQTLRKRVSTDLELLRNTGEVEFSKDEGPVKDLNTVSAQDLKSVYGIGEVLSARIIRFRNRLGGFLKDEQLYDVYGLETPVALRVLRKYRVMEKPEIKKININRASAHEISQLVYLSGKVSEEIVSYRDTKGHINSFDELLDLPGFPSEKIDRIILYLSL